MSKIGMIGMGKLGLPVALAIESKGHEVIGYDISPDPYEYMKNRHIPYTEEGLQPLLDKHQVKMVDTVAEVVAEADIVFLPVQTPHAPEYEGATRIPDTRADFNYKFLKEAISQVADEAKKQEKLTTLAVISTCLPGTFKREIAPIIKDNEYIDYVYTPQFIAMGTVLADYLEPEFNLIGVDSPRAAEKLNSFYKTINSAPDITTDITSAEAIKVSYNTFITMKTVLANAWGELAEKLGFNVDEVYRAWAVSGKRLLSPRYLRSGVGDGGGCHPRDNIALSYIAQREGVSHNIWEDLMKAREDHMEWIAKMGISFAQRHGLDLVILGRSFKPETNIETGSPAILLKNIIDEYVVEVEQYEDLEELKKAVYIVATQHERYQDYNFPKGSIVIDPFRYLPQQSGVTAIAIGKH